MNKYRNAAFTIVELVVIIVVIGILASITVIAYTQWREDIAEQQVRNDLLQVATEMNGLRNSQDGYPLALPSTYEASNGVTLTYVAGGVMYFCINGVNTAQPDRSFYIDSRAGNDVQEGSCVAEAAVTTVAGGTAGFNNSSTPSAVRFNNPYDIVMNSSGNFYIVDNGNNQIRLMSPSGTTSTFAGSTTAGFTNSTGTSARFNSPIGITIAASGNTFVTETGNDVIRRITPGAAVTTFAGSGTEGFSNGTGTAAAVRFNSPMGIAIDSSANFYVADMNNHNIRRVTSGAVTSNFAGNSTGTPGSGNGTGNAVSFNFPIGMAVDSTGAVYVSDRENNQIRKIVSTTTSTFAGSTTAGLTDGTGTAARFNKPGGLAVDSSGNVYVADTGNNAIRKITPAGVVTTVAGGTLGSSDGTGAGARFNQPSSLTIDGSGNLFVTDTGNHRIRKITLVP